MISRSITFLIIGLTALTSQAQSSWSDVYCTIRENGTTLNCQSMDPKGQKLLTANDISAFIDQAELGSFITVRSKRKLERVFQIDGNAKQFKAVNDAKRSASVSELSRLKNELFLDLEKRLIKLSDDLDNAAASAELIKYDPSVAGDRFRREIRDLKAENESFKKDQSKVCTSTPAFEALTRTNSGLQRALSNVLVAFNSPGTCMYDYMVFKDHDGTVDVRQLETVVSHYREQCKK